MLTRIATESDINAILQLQSTNLYRNLSTAELTEGFVTTPITVEQIKSILTQTGLFVVEQWQQVVGYTFAGSWDYFSQWAIFPYMLSRLTQIDFQGQRITTENSFQYGPVCIAKSLRGSGAFPQLFATMRRNLAPKYPLGITFINQINQRSLKAHQKLNLEIIDEFEFNQGSYYSLAFATQVD
ncbi:MAG: GNAT family acetyltransferase [Cyanobacteria bacterium J06635_13]